MIKVKFRATDPFLTQSVRKLFPSWDVRCSDIFTGVPADVIVSPANCIGRMDGGIDQVYINRFGWQLEKRLMRDIRDVYNGKLPIGKAHLITTYDPEIPLMISAPTMDWPPGDVSQTRNAYFAFDAVLKCAKTECVKALGRYPTILLPGLATGTGNMHPEIFANQLLDAWIDNHD